MSERLAVITVVYNNYSVLEGFFESLARQGNKNLHLFVTDLSEQKETISSRSLPTTVNQSKNFGYAHGVNIGLSSAMKADYNSFCVINNDTVCKENFVDNVIKSLKKHSSSIIGGKIYYAPGYEYHKKYPSNDLGHVLWYAGGSVDWKNAYTVHRGVDEVDRGQFDRLEKTDFVTGCLMCFDKKVVESVGLWDEKYFLYYEDADYCERAKNKGIALYYDPSIVIWHKNAQSTEGSGSILHQKYQRINRFKWGIKYAPFKTKLHLLKNHLFD
jgi:hypothetical protein